MSIIVPVQFEALVGREATIARGGAIRASTASALAQKAHYAYAVGALRTAVRLRGVDLTGVTSYVTIAKVRFDFAAQRELVGFRVAYDITNADVKITIRNAADSGDLVTPAAYTGTTRTNTTIGAPGSGNSAVVIKIEARRNSAAAASLNRLRIWEREHNASTLPS